MDHANMQLLLEQVSLLANLVWKQQMHICDLNGRHLRLDEERKRIVGGSDSPIYNSVNTIIGVVKSLQDDESTSHENFKYLDTDHRSA
jgi:hypothetical protein